jgi:RimJ/RimL family protein N-acetyltransferase
MASSFYSAAPAPVLETERLKLRGHCLADFAASSAMWADPVVTRHVGGRPLSQEECWSRLLRYVGHWALLGFGYWVVEEKVTGSFIGEIGFADYKRDMEPPLKDTPEIGWVFATQFHGMGYATEAVREAVAWGDARFGGGATACIIDPENFASIRVAEKCGYRKSHLANYKGHSTLVFVR